MAISYVAAGTHTAGTTTISPPLPSGVAVGDLMLLVVHTANNVISSVSGWTEVTNSPVSLGTANTAGGVRLSVYYRWYQSGDSAPKVTPTSGTVTNGRIYAFRGVDSANPFDATPVSGTKGTASTSASFPSITTATANAMIVLATALDLDAASTATTASYSNANLTSITERQDQTVSTATGGGTVVATATKATAGATGVTTATVTSTIQVYLTMALRPAVIASGTLSATESGSDTFAASGTVSGGGGGGGTVVRTGTAIGFAPGASSGSQSITVPSDATCMVVYRIGANDGSDPMFDSGGGSFTIGGQTITWRGRSPTADSMDGSVHLLVNPPTGTQTFAWSGLTESYSPFVGIVFYKGVDTADPILQVKTDTGVESLSSITTATGSMTSFCVGSFDAAVDTSGNGQTTVLDNQLGGTYMNADVAELSQGSSVSATGGQFPCILAISLKPSAGTSGSTGTLAATESGNDTLSASGKVYVKGSLAASETGADTCSSSGKVYVKGALSVSEVGSDTISSSGKVYVKGSLAASETGGDTFAASGKVITKGTLAATESGSDSLTSSGKVYIKGVLSSHEVSSDTCASSGKVYIKGALSAVESSKDTISSSGKVYVKGALSVTEAGSDTASITGVVVGVGQMSATESGSDSFSSSGTVKIQGSLGVSEASSDSLSANGTVKIQGSLVASEGSGDTFSATGTVPQLRYPLGMTVVSGTWKEILKGYVLTGESWREIKSRYILINHEWKER